MAEVGHDLGGEKFHRFHDLVVRNLTNVEGTVQVGDTGILRHAMNLFRHDLRGAKEPILVKKFGVVFLGHLGCEFRHGPAGLNG